MTMLKAAILCNGTPPSYELLKKELTGVELVVCADGSAKWALLSGVKIDVLVGDMDSLDNETLKRVAQSGCEIVRLNQEKDETDTQVAVDLAIARGADELVLLGATGTRLDHTLGNVQLLVHCCKRNIQARIVDEHNVLFVTHSKAEFSGEKGQILSIIPLGEHIETTTTGLYYPLKNHMLDLGQPLGVSNVFTGNSAGVEVSGGYAAVILAHD